MNAKTELIGKDTLPAGWRWARLGDVCVRMANGTSVTQNSERKGLPVTRIETISTGNINLEKVGWIDSSGDDLERYFLRAGDILFSHINSIEKLGNCAIYDGTPSPLVHGMNLLRLEVNQDTVDPQYLFAYLKSEAARGFYNQNARRAIGQASLNTKDLDELPILLPLLPEQRRIAARLNEIMAEIARARAAAQAALDAANALPAALLRAVFESDEAKGWERKRFDEVAILQRGHDLPIQDQIPGEYPIMGSNGIIGMHNAFTTKAPGVVTGRSGSIGKVHYVEKDYWAHNTALYVKEFKDGEPKYVYFLLQWMDLRKIRSGTGVPTLDRKQVHKVIIPHPKRDRQIEIARTLSEQMIGAYQLRASAQSQLDAINALPAAYLRRAFRGEL